MQRLVKNYDVTAVTTNEKSEPVVVELNIIAINETVLKRIFKKKYPNYLMTKYVEHNDLFKLDDEKFYELATRERVTTE